jgi:GNAT superfamily N-acetyltransferase
MQIRQLQQEDKEQMLVLMEEFWIKYNRGELLTDELKELAEYKDYQSLMRSELEKYFTWESYVAEENGKLLGFVCARIEDKEYKVLDKLGYIEELFVTETVRGQKIGTQLLEKIISVLKEKGCNVLGIDAYAPNESALKLYRKLGFIDHNVVLMRKVD